MIRTRFKLARWEEIAIREYKATQLRRIVTPHPPEKYADVYPETVVPGIPEWLWSKTTSGQGAGQQDLFWLREKPVRKIGLILKHVCADGRKIVLKVQSVSIGRAKDVTEDEAARCGIPATDANWKYPESILGLPWDDATLEDRVRSFWFWIVKQPQAFLHTRKVWKIDVEVLEM